ncbi:MAG: hypothetical protein H8E35_07760 [Ardenticatenia bacterium]|nr:hypothetical protein [Ardenticatenia bacterium]
MEVLKQLLDEHATRLGISPDRVEPVRIEMDVLLERGTLIDLDVRGISLFSTRATWEELGVPAEATRRARFTKGAKYLVPKPYISSFRSLETRARRWLNDHSFDVMGFRPYRYVPFTAYKTWRGGSEKLVKEWGELKTKLLSEHEALLATLEEDFEEVAREAAHALGLRDEAQRELVTRVVERAQAAMPSHEALAFGLTLDYRAGMLLGRSRIEQELLSAARLETKRRETLAKARVAEAEADQKKRQLAEMRKAELKHYKEQLQQMASPMSEVFHQIRAQMHEDAAAVLETMCRNEGKLIGPAVRRARSMIETFRLLNVLDDEGLERLLDGIDRNLSVPAPERKVGDLEKTLRQIADLTKESAAEVQRLAVPSRWGALRL